MSDEITVGIVSWYEADLVEGLVSNLIHKTSNDSRLNFIVCDNTNGQDRELYLRLGRTCRIIPNDQGRQPQCWHAKGLHVLQANMDTELGLFIDPDCLMLMNGWDIVCKSALSDRVVAVGAPYPPTMLNKCHGFPVAYCMLFKPQLFKELGADWMPRGVPNKVVAAKDLIMRNAARFFSHWMGQLFGPAFFVGRGGYWARKVFGCTSKDVGWQVIRLMRKRGYSGRVFDTALLPDQIRPECRVMDGVMELAKEFQLYLWEGVPIATHLYSTGHQIRGKNKSKASQTSRWRSLAYSVSAHMDNFDVIL